LELFVGVGIKATNGVLVYGPPGTGKTLLARVLASNINATFLKVVASAIVDKYIGESARVIREMFAFARDQLKVCAEEMPMWDQSNFAIDHLHPIITS
jgi:26S proteasome regulatory subunit T4